ncbi:UL36 very large tegument protein [Streptomyces sp. NPDC101490]|uniref:UL36 very large tegument protein n=1 Tax=Streptomyces sp. NPDC101490 TaxID=3366143 RepID=UPI003819E850
MTRTRPSTETEAEREREAETEGETAAFTRWLTALVERLPASGGWYGVFSTRDPEGMRACLEGAEIPPWDVIDSLLRDTGEDAGGPLATRGRKLYEEAVTAHDRRPGGADALAGLRDLMERERRYAESRARDLDRSLRAVPPPDPAATARLEHDLAWVRDDHARATARIADLTARLASLAPPPAAGPPLVRPARRPRGARYAWLDSEEHTDAEGRRDADARTDADRHGGGGADGGGHGDGVGHGAGGGRRDRGGSRGGDGSSGGGRSGGSRPGHALKGPEPAPLPVLPAGGAAPRGARFGGAPVQERAPAAAPAAFTEVDTRAAANAVYALRRLRAQGRTGEAHALLCEALSGPPARLPALAEELRRAGLAADWATLLWEAASLPPARLAAVAGALADAGRPADCERLLSQGVARPVEELAGACAALRAEDHHREAHTLLTAFVRVRAPGDAARLAGADPRGLVPQLLAAARAVSVARERDLLHAFRVAGLAGT